MSLFGSNNQTQGTSSIFGGQTKSLFGNSTTPQSTSGGAGSIFSTANSNTAPAATSASSLFGSTTPAVAPQNAFGGNNNSTAPTGSNIFGNSAGQQQNASVLGGGGTSLFGASKQQPSTSNFGAGAVSTTQNQNAASRGLRSSLFQPEMVTVGSAGHSMSSAALQYLQFSGASTTPNEKSIPEQIETLAKKWAPPPRDGAQAGTAPSDTILRTYFYNATKKAYAPFFYPKAGEAEKSWEEALAKRPEIPNIEGTDSAVFTYVPVECVGFFELSQRIATQAETVKSMRQRLHEMNDSLSTIMDTHQQRITVKIAAAKKQHQALRERCVRLAVKVQVLRNRGYALDKAEENLRRMLLALENQVQDPGFAGREDEIWARMVSLRERTRWLEEESKRLSAQLNAQGNQSNTGSGSATSVLPENVLVQTRKILKDYGDQLGHLNKELMNVKKEYDEWIGQRA